MREVQPGCYWFLISGLVLPRPFRSSGEKCKGQKSERGGRRKKKTKKKEKRKKKERKKNLLASKINLIKAPSKLRISSGWKQRIGKKGKQPSSLLARSKNFQVRGGGREEGWKREEEESRLKILVPCLIQSPWPMSVFSRSTYRKLSLIKCLISACFSLYSLSSLVGNPGCLVRDTLFKFRHCSLPRDSSLASILRFVVNRRCFNNLRENIYQK